MFYAPVRPAGVQIRQGPNLPHWEKPGATYAVTFHQADSVPAAVLLKWKKERQDLETRSARERRGLSVHEQARMDWLTSGAVQDWLDAGHGSCAMRDPAIAEQVAISLRHFQGERYELAAWCVMPNHVHVVFRPLADFSMPGVLQSWKGFTGHWINRRLAQSGAFWQKESYDHLIRNALEYRHAVRYALDNPAKARLGNWPWVGSDEQFAWRL